MNYRQRPGNRTDQQAMASHSRHVLSVTGEVRAQVKFRREDLLLVHDRPLRDPFAAEKQRRAVAEGHDPRLLVVEVPGLPVRTENGNMVGPNLLDMLVRRSWRFEALPPAAQQAVIAAVRAAKQSRLPREVVAWSARGLDTLWPAPGQEQRRGPWEPDGGGEERELDHPFVASLVSGGVPHGTAPAGWVRVRKYSTCQVGEYIYRVAAGMHGGLGAAYARIAEVAAEAWTADQSRALVLWEMVQAAPDGVLLEDEAVRRLRPICSVSQEAERIVMREVCRWVGVDPDLALKRERGRPKGSGAQASDQGKVIRLAIQPDGTVRGAFIADYGGVPEGTELHAVRLHVLVGVLGALRLAGLDTDHALLEAWLDAAVPDWRERMAEEGQAAPGGAALDPYEVLGVTPQDDMAAVTAAYRRAMKAVHPDTSGGASAWLSRAVADAYKQIRAARAA